MDYYLIENEVRKALSDRRFTHSKGVAKRAVELAKIYNEDEEQARLIGIAHDIAKEIPQEEALKYANENGIIFDEIEKYEPGLWHSKLGADIAGKKFGFTNSMKQAILYHTTGNVNMNTMDKIIFVADKTEENRTYEEVEEIRRISNENLDKAVLYCAKRSINYSLNKITLIHPDTIELINKLIMNNK